MSDVVQAEIENVITRPKFKFHQAQYLLLKTQFFGKLLWKLKT